MGRSSRNDRVLFEEHHKNPQSSAEGTVAAKPYDGRENERDLHISPIEIARGNPRTGKVGSQRPAAEQHNRMIALQEGFRYRKDGVKNEIIRVEAGRIYAEIRGQLYSPDAFNLPRGVLTLGKMRQAHFRKLMQLRKSLEKRCASLSRAVGHWSSDNLIDDVLRRDRSRGLTPRSKYFVGDVPEDHQIAIKAWKKRTHPRQNKVIADNFQRKERRGTGGFQSIPRRRDTMSLAGSDQKRGKNMTPFKLASTQARCGSNRDRHSDSDSDTESESGSDSEEEIRNHGGYDSEPETDQYDEPEYPESDLGREEISQDQDMSDTEDYDEGEDVDMNDDNYSSVSDGEEKDTLKSPGSKDPFQPQ